MSTATLAVALTAEIRLPKPGQLEVSYRLVNHTRDDLCVFDKLYRTKLSGERVLDEHMAYVLLEDPATLRLTRSVIAIPAGLKVEYPEVPYVTVLAPGKSLEGKVLLPVPVPETHPYMEALTPGTGKERVCNQVDFSIGVLPKTPRVALRPLPKVGEGVFAVDYGPAIAGQSLIKGPVVNLKVAALMVQPRPRWAK
jgi:hypothetical protein